MTMMQSDKELAFDRLHALLHLEKDYYIMASISPPCDSSSFPSFPHAPGENEAVASNSKTNSSSNSTTTIDNGDGGYLAMMPESRNKIATWAYDVVDYFGFPRDAVAWMMYYMDRMLVQCALANGPRNQEFLLLTVSSFYLAIKLACKPSNMVFPIHAMINIAKNQFSEQQIADAEFRILEGLGWRVHPPTADQFVYALIDICCCPRDHNENRHHQIKDYAVYLIELSVLDYFFVHFKPSEIAVAALYCAQEMVLDMGISVDMMCTSLGNAATSTYYHHRQVNSFTSFELDPAQVLQCVLEPSRVAACRSRFSLVVERRYADVATVFAECHHHDHLGQSRTGSPVSVHPQDTTTTTAATNSTSTGITSESGSSCHGSNSSASATVVPADNIKDYSRLDLEGTS